MYFGYDVKWCLLPTLGGDPQKSLDLREAANRRDWRAMNRTGFVWYDRYADRWFKFGPNFWDVGPHEYHEIRQLECNQVIEPFDSAFDKAVLARENQQAIEQLRGHVINVTPVQTREIPAIPFRPKPVQESLF